MPVTTGNTTSNTNKTSNNPSGGGPGGGSLSAPNRTAPSTGTGGQKATTSSSKTSPTKSTGGNPTGGSLSAPARTAPSTSTSKSPSSSSPSSKDTSSRNPTGGSLSAPNRTAPSNYNSGISGSKNGGASTQKPGSGTGSKAATPTTRGGNPTGGSISAPARTAPSAKVTDPSRDGSYNVNKSFSENWFKGTNTGRALDALSGGRISKATESLPGEYKRSVSGTQTAWGNGGLTPSPNEQLAKDVSGILGNYKLPERTPVAQDPSVAGRAAQANKNYTTTTAPGGMVSRTYNDPDVAAAQQAGQPGFTDRITRSLQSVNDRLQSAFGVPEAGPNRGLANPTVGEQLGAAAVDAYGKIKAGAGSFIDNLMGQPMIGENPNASPIADKLSKSMQPYTTGDIAMRNALQSTVVPKDGLAAWKEGLTNTGALNPYDSSMVKKAEAAVPKAPTQDEKRQQAVQEIQQARAPSMPAAPEMGVEDVLAPQPATPNRGNYSFPNFDPSSPEQANAINMARQMSAGLGDVATSQPQTAAPANQPARQPTEVDINAGPEAPSQQGNFPPDRNFMQDDGQAQSVAELQNRYEYEKARAKDGFKQLPGRLASAILGGDLRPYQGTENDKRGDADPASRANQLIAQQAIASLPPDQQAQLVTLLMSLIQQQQAGNSQAALVNNTFV
jgi:uncharacterized protein YjbJ (UPF0337 family)